jgi:hypothetical protein
MEDLMHDLYKIRAEGNNTKCVGKKKIQWQCCPQASERACVTFSPYFEQGQIIYAN